VAANPLGSTALEKTDCGEVKSWFTRYKKFKRKKKK
jgi:hypothetical protein